MTDKPNPLKLATVTELPQPSTVDLTNLPERLNDAQLAAVEAMARQPLPELPPCPENHLAQCLRVMLAVLPKQNTDELGGELFVRAYIRHLSSWPKDAISHLADRATGECKWFPTIVECREILDRWTRNDEAVQRRNLAWIIANRERNARAKPEPDNWTPEPGELDRIKQGVADALRADRPSGEPQ